MVSITKRTIVTFTVFGLLSLVSLSAFAQKIGIVDGNKVLENYSEYKTAQSKIESTVKSWQDTAAMMQKNLKEKFEGYQKIKETMSKEALAKADEEVNK